MSVIWTTKIEEGVTYVGFNERRAREEYEAARDRGIAVWLFRGAVPVQMCPARTPDKAALGPYWLVEVVGRGRYYAGYSETKAREQYSWVAPLYPAHIIRVLRDGVPVEIRGNQPMNTKKWSVMISEDTSTLVFLAYDGDNEVEARDEYEKWRKEARPGSTVELLADDKMVLSTTRYSEHSWSTRIADDHHVKVRRNTSSHAGVTEVRAPKHPQGL